MLLSHGLRAAAGAKQFSFLEARRNSADQISYTETNVSLGEPHPNRAIIACVLGQGLTSPSIVNSITIDSTAMTLYKANSTGQSGWFGVLNIPNGTTASSIVTTFNTTQGIYAIAFFRAVNLDSLVPIVTNGITSSSATTLSLSNTTPTKGFSIFGERHSNNNVSTLTNVTSTVNGGTNGNGYDSFAFINNLLEPESTQTVTASWTGSVGCMLIQGTFR